MHVLYARRSTVPQGRLERRTSARSRWLRSMRPCPGVEILPHSTTAGGETSPVRMLCAGDGPLLVGISRDQAGIHRKSLAADQLLLDTTAHHRFEDMPERIAVANPTVPVLGEGGVVRHIAVEAEPAEPAIGQIEVHLFTEPPLGADAEAVADQQHPDHQLGINRGSACRAVERRQMSPKPVRGTIIWAMPEPMPMVSVSDGAPRNRRAVSRAGTRRPPQCHVHRPTIRDWPTHSQWHRI
jgi:hypothetical protein